MAEPAARRSSWPARLGGLPLLVLTPLLAAVLAWPVLVLVLLVDLLWWPLARARRQRMVARPRDLGGASIVVVSWNGRHFLEKLLPTLRAATLEHGGDHEVIVVDNGSKDGSCAWLAEHWPWVKVVALPENRFFVRGNMAGVQVASRDVVVFLNNDMQVRPGFLGPLLDGLRDPRVFGVTAQVFFTDPHKRREETGRTRGELRAGALKLAHELPSRDELELDFAPAFWAGGGSSAFDRRLFLELGGFDTLYDPFYLEDTGLSYQAWKRGFLVLFTGRSQVLHEHRGTSRKVFGDDHVDGMIRRNQHLFTWRNITDPGLLAANLLLLPLHCVARAARPGRSLQSGLWFELRALLRALPRLPEALRKRCADRRWLVRTDREVAGAANPVVGCRRLTGAPLGRLPAPRHAASVDGLRLLVLAARLPRRHFDGSWVVFERLRLLAQRHRVTLFAFLDEPADERHAEPLRQAGIEVITAVRERNPLPGNWHGLQPHRLWRDYAAPAMQRAVVRALEGTDYDVVQVEYIEMAHLLARVPGAIPAGVPVVYTCHESLALAARRELRQARGLRARLPAARAFAAALRHERRLLRRMDRVVALSTADAGWLREWQPDLPVDVVPSGIDPAPWRRDGVAEAPATILFVGYFGHEPNVDAALWLLGEILPRVRAALPAVTVELVGRAVPPVLEQAVAGSGGAARLCGFVPDLAATLAAATVVAMPLRAGGGLRGKVLEAWAAARPVVATTVALEGIDGEPGRHALVADDAGAFADALLRCLGDAALRRRLGEAGARLVGDRHSAAAMAAGHERVLRDALTKSRLR